MAGKQKRQPLRTLPEVYASIARCRDELRGCLNDLDEATGERKQYDGVVVHDDIKECVDDAVDRLSEYL